VLGEVQELQSAFPEHKLTMSFFCITKEQRILLFA